MQEFLSLGFSLITNGYHVKYERREAEKQYVIQPDWKTFYYILRKYDYNDIRHSAEISMIWLVERIVI